MPFAHRICSGVRTSGMNRRGDATITNAQRARLVATDGGRPFFVMEMVRGVPITEFCDEAKAGLDARLSQSRALEHTLADWRQRLRAFAADRLP